MLLKDLLGVVMTVNNVFTLGRRLRFDHTLELIFMQIKHGNRCHIFALLLILDAFHQLISRNVLHESQSNQIDQPVKRYLTITNLNFLVPWSIA